MFGLGVRTTIGITGEDPGTLADAVRHAWTRCLEPRGGERDGPAIVVGIDSSAAGPPEPAAAGRTGRDSRQVVDTDIARLMPRLTQAVTTASITEQSGSLLMIHAGAVTNPETRATFAYAAPGGTGKTTLSTLLGRQWCYVTDETVAVTDDGGVIAYEKPLSTRMAADVPKGAPRFKSELSPDDLRLRILPREGRIHLAGLALIVRDDHVRQPVVEELDTLTAMVCLAPETSSLSRLPTPLTRLADLLDSIAPVVRITYAEAADIEPIISAVLRGDS